MNNGVICTINAFCKDSNIYLVSNLLRIKKNNTIIGNEYNTEFVTIKLVSYKLFYDYTYFYINYLSYIRLYIKIFTDYIINFSIKAE